MTIFRMEVTIQPTHPPPTKEKEASDKIINLLKVQKVEEMRFKCNKSSYMTKEHKMLRDTNLGDSRWM